MFGSTLLHRSCSWLCSWAGDSQGQGQGQGQWWGQDNASRTACCCRRQAPGAGLGLSVAVTLVMQAWSIRQGPLLTAPAASLVSREGKAGRAPGKVRKRWPEGAGREAGLWGHPGALRQARVMPEPCGPQGHRDPPQFRTSHKLTQKERGTNKT